MSDPFLRAVVGALALSGASIAGYLTYAKLTDSTIVCTTGGCETVQDSAYAKLAGVPVAALGLVAYLAVAATALGTRESVRLLGTATAGAGAVFSGYLVVVQAAVIDAFCLWCLASDLVMGLLAAATVLRVLSGRLPAGAH